MLLLDAGIYGFLVIRKLQHVGFDLRLRLADLRIGARELAFYAPIAIALGLALGFLHFHAYVPSVSQVLLAWIFTFFFIAVPEELFFRGWIQNLLERRHWPALGVGCYGCALRVVALQQACGTFQLALRRARNAGGSFLWPCVASATPCWGIGNYPCLGRYSLVDLAAMSPPPPGINL